MSFLSGVPACSHISIKCCCVLSFILKLNNLKKRVSNEEQRNSSAVFRGWEGHNKTGPSALWSPNTHTYTIHRHWLLFRVDLKRHIQEESFSTNKLTEMALFFVWKIRAAAGRQRCVWPMWCLAPERTASPVWLKVRGDYCAGLFIFDFLLNNLAQLRRRARAWLSVCFSFISICCFLMILCFTWQQRQITGPQRSTWPWWWGITQCLGGPQKRRCVKRSTLPCWPAGYLHQTSPAVLPAPGCRQWRTDAGPSVLQARRSSRWTRSLSYSAVKNAAPWCCPS